MAHAIGENHARRRLAAGELVLCMGVNQLRSPNIALIAAACGFDAIYLDLEHNPTSLETAASVCVAALGAGVTPIARIASHDAHDMARILDCGAQGIMVPHVNSAEEASAIVSACRFAPIGHRSAAGTVPALGYAALGQAEINRRLNEETLLIAMLETPEAIGQVEAIAAVPGIDCLLIGSSDLSMELGVPGDNGNAKIQAAADKVVAACKKHGKWPGMGGAYSEELLKLYTAKGMKLILAGNDLPMLTGAARAHQAKVRAFQS